MKDEFFAYLGIFDVLMRLGVVLFIAYSPWQFDRLIIYAMLLVGVSVIWQLATWYIAVGIFKSVNCSLLSIQTIGKK